MSSKGLGRNHTRKSLDLIAVDRVGTQPQRPALGMSTSPLASFPLFMGQPNPDTAPTGATQQPASLDQIKVAPDSPGIVVAAQNPRTDQSAIPPQTQPLTPPEPPKTGDLATVATPQSPPEDYLESSEQLLRSLAQEETETSPAPKKPFAAKLLTPLGVGSILLLLLSGATAAVVLSNPSLLDRFFGPKTPTSPQSSTEPTSTVGNAAKDAPVVNGPDLAADEFVDLNLNTLSHLQTSPKASPSVPSVQVPALPTLQNGATIPPVAPSVVPNTALPQRASDLSSVLLTPPPQASNPPYTPIPRVAPLPTTPTAAPKSNTAKSNKTSAASTKSNTAKSNKTATTESNKSNTAKSNKTATAESKSNTAKSNKTATAESKSNTAKSNKTATAESKSNTAKANPANTSTKAPVAKQQPPSPTPAAVAASPVGIPGGYYYVLLNEQGERTLEQARTIVADAYVERFPKGERIQMGAFPTESEAKAMVEELQRQGLAASIYHP